MGGYIEERHSVRLFTSQEVQQDDIEKIILAGIMAPSAENRQPWRFKVFREKEIIQKIASGMKRSKWISGAPVVIGVFIKTDDENKWKDYMAVGACIENMLLKSCQLGLGACWVGEGMNNQFREKNWKYDDKILVALVAVGYERKQNVIGRTSREKLKYYLIENNL